MKPHTKPLLAALFVCCSVTLPALVAAQSTPAEPQSQQSGQAASPATANPTTVGPVDQAAPSTGAAPEAPAPLESTPAQTDGQTAGDAAGNPAPGETPALSLLNNRIGPNYLIGPEDVLTIDVFDVPELSKFDAQVANDGTISVPLIGPVKAAGLTQGQLRDELSQEWGRKYLNHPQVTLFIKDFKSRPVSVIGSVAKPGVYYMTGRRTLVEVLALAGGLAGTGASAGKDVFVERASGFQDVPQADGIKQIAPDKVSVELKKLLYSQDTALDIEVKPFDIVSVSRAGVVYIVGAFNRPGGYVLTDKETITVLEAVAMAQGVGGNARTSQAKIIRRSGTNATASTEIPFDLKKIMRGKSPDMELAASDILFLPNSSAKGIAKGTASSIIGIISGVVIYRGL